MASSDLPSLLVEDIHSGESGIEVWQPLETFGVAFATVPSTNARIIFEGKSICSSRLSVKLSLLFASSSEFYLEDLSPVLFLAYTIPLVSLASSAYISCDHGLKHSFAKKTARSKWSHSSLSLIISTELST